ncbi:hypothetical protein Zm00014a_036604 [Zea mays]|uniref:Uncharacterized protein n=1 Tax=Zea mays TaxID=4577 RepID=A0A3L6F0A3_MAIZE|nr:hypothetical protein Zm00014a_036604 [Zea mays]
MKSMKIKFI